MRTDGRQTDTPAYTGVSAQFSTIHRNTPEYTEIHQNTPEYTEGTVVYSGVHKKRHDSSIALSNVSPKSLKSEFDHFVFICHYIKWNAVVFIVHRVIGY